MCLAVPAKLIQLKGTDGVVDLHGSQLPISILLVPEAREGDWLLVHAGFAIQRLDEREAEETFAIFKESGQWAVGGGQEEQPNFQRPTSNVERRTDAAKPTGARTREGK